MQRVDHVDASGDDPATWRKTKGLLKTLTEAAPASACAESV